MMTEQTSAPRAALYLRSSVADDEQVDHQRRALEALGRPEGMAKLLHVAVRRQFDVPRPCIGWPGLLGRWQ